MRTNICFVNLDVKTLKNWEFQYLNILIFEYLLDLTYSNTRNVGALSLIADGPIRWLWALWHSAKTG